MLHLDVQSTREWKDGNGNERKMIYTIGQVLVIPPPQIVLELPKGNDKKYYGHLELAWLPGLKYQLRQK